MSTVISKKPETIHLAYSHSAEYSLCGLHFPTRTTQVPGQENCKRCTKSHAKRVAKGAKKT